MANSLIRYYEVTLVRVASFSLLKRYINEGESKTEHMLSERWQNVQELLGEPNGCGDYVSPASSRDPKLYQIFWL